MPTNEMWPDNLSCGAAIGRVDLRYCEKNKMPKTGFEQPNT